MKVLKITKKNSGRILNEIIKILKNGGIVALPTDTVLGLIAIASDENAVKKIFAMKNRHLEKPISIFTPNIKEAEKHARVSPKNKKILNRLLESEVLEKTAFVLPLKNTALKTAAADGKTIGIRIPKDNLILEILKKIKEPLAQTSANLSGLPEAQNAREVIAYFKTSRSKPDLVINGKIKPKIPSSSVIDLTKTPPKIIREGAVSRKQLEKILGLKVKLSS